MSASAQTRREPRRAQSGYALLVVIFLATAMLIAAAVATPNLLTQGRREREEEMIWRGEQYIRAVRLYYRKYGRFPQSLEDLAEPKNQVRFLRKPYPDPMNREDGNWRLIYVGPSGELIGSITRTSAVQLSRASRPGQALPGTAGAAGMGGAPGPPAKVGEPPEVATAGEGGGGGAPPTPGATPAQPSALASGAGSDVTGKIFGGNIIGVASKIPRSSIKVYKGFHTYRQWEFIWDPAADAAAAMPPGSRPGGLPSGQPAGTPPQNPNPPPPPPQ